MAVYGLVPTPTRSFNNSTTIVHVRDINRVRYKISRKITTFKMTYEVLTEAKNSTNSTPQLAVLFLK